MRRTACILLVMLVAACAPPTTCQLLPSIACHYYELIVASGLVVLENAGHLPQEEQPERVVREIHRWLSIGTAG